MLRWKPLPRHNCSLNLKSYSRLTLRKNYCKNWLNLVQYNLVQLYSWIKERFYEVKMLFGGRSHRTNPSALSKHGSNSSFVSLFTEQQLREDNKPLFGSLSSRQSDCLRSLVKVAATYSQVVNPDMAKQHCILLLSCKY